MKIYTDCEIDKVVNSIIQFRQKQRERKKDKLKRIKMLSLRKEKSQLKKLNKR